VSGELVLRLPRLDEEDEVLRARRSTPDVAHFLHYYQEGMSFARYLEVLAEQERGINLPTPHHAPSTSAFAFVGERLVGRASIRHSLTERLERIGGHVGYVVVPEFRRRGYATEILRQSLAYLRDQLGLTRALVTCDDDNVGSIRTIEKNGGVLENVVTGPDLVKPKRRYWIELGRSG
jgi:predicted acetyltransferase